MKKFAWILSLVLCMGLFSGCGNKASDDGGNSNTSAAVEEKEKAPAETAKPEDEEEVEAVSLSDWESLHPEWKSITAFYKESYVSKAADKLGKKEDKSGPDLLEEHAAGAHSEIASITFSGDTLTLKDDADRELAKSKYRYIKTLGKGVEHGEFAVFEAEEEVPEQFKYLALMEPHGGEGDITHFHARYAKAIDAPELEDGDWWPVFVDPDSTQDQVIHEILGEEE
ncbi:Zn/Cd-binding protein ZinT [Peptoniphilus ivorii]|uniref:ZinT/AdcA family metal-binding protein n=1 Tax=Aedoeadaptatus ivorii TaxID=54006 RepID=UPI00277D2B82|nr:ZinT/AdcA family metal-binding protein [Peptoniphilus ivorii]MDQ0509017.1 Zn/Cd-binding protein ZinT [Peptoniphilus ivorii]